MNWPYIRHWLIVLAIGIPLVVLCNFLLFSCASQGQLPLGPESRANGTNGAPALVEHRPGAVVWLRIG